MSDVAERVQTQCAAQELKLSTSGLREVVIVTLSHGARSYDGNPAVKPAVGSHTKKLKAFTLRGKQGLSKYDVGNEDRSVPHCGGGAQPSRGIPGGAMPSGVKAI